ncbi:ArsR/SmtB family transcription factor [Nocardiopsis baichengensis]|uniref:ArsR/SmtB family transcription factor n=1 Tax=Nocardiopsis baichengensis TaxID=280240 RepID=UPI00034BB40F|nr:winged helix-turn-helix domain-containing protein [Nocardiopsis baichengensis]
MLRIHFTDADLARTRVAPGADPMWELVLSLHRLQNRRGRNLVDRWYGEARERLAASGLTPALKNRLIPIAPQSMYFPDFLTPDEGQFGFEPALEAIEGLPRRELEAQLGIVAAMGDGLGSWARALADGDRRARRELAESLREYRRVALEPFWDDLHADVDADRVRRSRDLLEGGVHGLLAGFEPLMRWEQPVLHVVYPGDHDIELPLRGRGLRLIPSYFCWKYPVALADPELPPVLVYPMHNGVYRTRRQNVLSSGGERALGNLLGATRAAALTVVADGATTNELAARLHISPAAASHHTRVLREAGLIVSTRDRNHVLHTLTAAGAELLGAGRRT